MKIVVTSFHTEIRSWNLELELECTVLYCAVLYRLSICQNLRNISWIVFTLLFALCLPVSDLIHYYYCYHDILIFPFYSIFIWHMLIKFTLNEIKNQESAIPFREMLFKNFKIHSIYMRIDYMYWNVLKILACLWHIFPLLYKN